VDLERRVAGNTFARYVIGKRKAALQISEEMRILYVALTRAKEKLFLVGTAKGKGGSRVKPGMTSCGAGMTSCGPGMTSRGAGKSFLDWVLMARPEEDEGVWDIRISDGGSAGPVGTTPSAPRAGAATPPGEGNLTILSGEGGLRDEVFRRLSYEYPHRVGIYAPAKMSVSEVKRLYWREFLGDTEEFGRGDVREFSKPGFLRDDRIDSAGLGIIVHTVLEHIDIAKYGREDVINTSQLLVANGIITEVEAGVVPVDSIVRFLESDIADRMRRAVVLRREMPFATAVAPGLVNMAFEGETQEEMLLHGVIDCVFEEACGMVIVDYKTERVRGDIETVARRYLPQMELYQYAVERIFGAKVAQRVIYFFDRDCEVVV